MQGFNISIRSITGAFVRAESEDAAKEYVSNNIAHYVDRILDSAEVCDEEDELQWIDIRYEQPDVGQNVIFVARTSNRNGTSKWQHTDREVSRIHRGIWRGVLCARNRY